ncbi:MAG: hypothetical protein RMJ31_01215 [Nitrososphaerota archaeon]|nr:hypothetical protein [Nitrososphaerales archaeon]MDW8044384.1 hypothetical protein [Nitrososphaerota archaeon]
MGLKRAVTNLPRSFWQKININRITRRFSKFLSQLELNKALEIIYLIFIATFAGGALNAILEGSRLPPGYIIAPTPTIQTLSETVIHSFAIVFGTSGIYLLYKSGKQVMRQRLSNLYFIAGLFMMILMVIIELFIFTIKRF